MSQIMQNTGKTALVTGAAGGIGQAIVGAMLASGTRVVLVDRDAASLARVADRFGAAAVPVTIDLADPDAVISGIAGILDSVGQVDILVNNAGILTSDKLATTTLADWHRLMAINLDAAMLLTKACLPAMRAAGWGRVINIASYAWKSGGLTASTAYAVSKAALVGLTFSTARETAAAGITSNAIAPAYVISPMIMEQLNEADRARQLRAIPVGRFCAPEEVAHTATFLASPLAGFITGEVIDMNGGMQFD